MNGMEKTGSAMVLHQFYEHFPAIGQLLGGQDISPHQSTFNPASLSYTSPGFQTQQSWPSEAAEGPSVFGWPPPVPTNVPMSWDPTWSDTQAEPRTAYSEPRSSVWGSIGSGAPSHTLHQSIRSERESRSAFPSLGPSSHLYPLPIYNPSLSGGSNPGNLLPDHMNNTNWQENQTSWSNHTFAPWPSTFLGPTSSQPNSSGTGDPPTYLNEESQIQGNPFTWPSGSSQIWFKLLDRFWTILSKSWSPSKFELIHYLVACYCGLLQSHWKGTESLIIDKEGCMYIHLVFEYIRVNLL